MILGSTVARLRALVLALASACTPAERLPATRGEPLRDYEEGTRLLQTSPSDQAMNAAIARARSTVPRFVSRLEQARPGLTYAGVKVPLGDPDRGLEHIWLYDVTYADGKIAGRLVDDGQRYPELRAGDVVHVAPREISDWMTVEDGRACGGFTSRIVVSEMSDAGRAAYMAEMGIRRLPPGDAVCDDGSSGA